VVIVRGNSPHTLIRTAETWDLEPPTNQGLRIMRGRYALLLNSDTVLTNHAIEELFTFMETHPEDSLACGHSSCRRKQTKTPLQFFPSLLTLMTNMPLLEYLFPKHIRASAINHKNPVEVDSAIGACLLVFRKKAIGRSGDVGRTLLFLFWRRQTGHIRMKKATGKICHIPRHSLSSPGQSIGSDVRSRIEFYRSRYLFFRK